MQKTVKLFKGENLNEQLKTEIQESTGDDISTAIFQASRGEECDCPSLLGTNLGLLRS